MTCGRVVTHRDSQAGAGSARGRAAVALALLTAAAWTSACRTTTRGSYFWVEALPVQEDDAGYRIAKGDVLGVRVWNQESMSTARAVVRNDGMISVPFLQDVDVAGMTPAELSQRLQVRLKPFIVSPVVTITLEERAPIRVSVLGEVAKPGAYDLPAGAGVLHALAAAGGLTAYAPRDGVYVLRAGYWADGNPAPARIRFRYPALSSGEVRAATFRLRGGDVIVVE